MSLQQVQPGSFVTLHYRLRGPDGVAIVDTFGAGPATLSLGTGELAPAMESRLIGLTEGDCESFALASGEAFGERNADLLRPVSLALLHQHGEADASYAVGDVVQFPAPNGQGTYAGVVRALAGDSLLIDFNHPLAGRPVTFDVQLIGVL
jgi:FKBP-type peptidyl-prolyl cis-trans isomerase SlpA